MTDIDLKPCPFCGGEADISHDHTVEENHAYGCRRCGIWFDTFNSDEAFDAWNARTATKGETWAEMIDRHALEKAEAVMALEAQGMTQTEAAQVLDMPLVNLNNFVKRNGLTWRVVRQGFASRDPESLSPFGVNNPPAGERMQ